jgi:hypothetical protein
MESVTIAHSHCEDCFTGVKHSGDPVGKSITIADIPTYLSEPSSSIAPQSGPKKVVLFFADVYGPFYLNNQLLQDYFASQGQPLRPITTQLYDTGPGFFVLGIDYFLGDPIFKQPEGYDRDAWIGASRAKALEITPKWIEEVRKQYGWSFMFIIDISAEFDLH